MFVGMDSAGPLAGPLAVIRDGSLSTSRGPGPGPGLSASLHVDRSACRYGAIVVARPENPFCGRSRQY